MKYIVIIGCGKTGRELAREFSHQHNVVVIDKSKYALDSLGEDFNGKKVLGDALDLKVLEDAGIKEVDILVLATGNDNVNIVISKVAKKLYKNIKKIALQVYDTSKKKIFSEEGLIIVNKTYILVEVFKKCLL